jgi:hypothetical protein
MKILINLIAWWLFFCLAISSPAKNQTLSPSQLGQLNHLAADIDSIAIVFCYKDDPPFRLTHVLASNRFYAYLAKGDNKHAKWTFAQAIIADFWSNQAKAAWEYLLQYAANVIWENKTANGYVVLPMMTRETMVDKFIIGLNEYKEHFHNISITIYFHDQP